MSCVRVKTGIWKAISTITFFFNASIPFESKRIKQRIENIKASLNEKIMIIQEEENNKIRLQEETLKLQQNITDVFEEMRKFKCLLDEGIITEEEYIKKKCQLLGL